MVKVMASAFLGGVSSMVPLLDLLAGRGGFGEIRMAAAQPLADSGMVNYTSDEGLMR